MAEYENGSLLFAAYQLTDWKICETTQRFLRRVSAETGRRVGFLASPQQEGDEERMPLSIIDKATGHVWVHPLVAGQMRRYLADLRVRKDGYVYAVTSPLTACIKIGSWKGKMDALEETYRACYGRDIDLDWAAVRNCEATEINLHDRFANSAIGSGLFTKNRAADVTEAFIELKMDLSS